MSILSENTDKILNDDTFDHSIIVSVNGKLYRSFYWKHCQFLLKYALSKHRPRSILQNSNLQIKNHCIHVSTVKGNFKLSNMSNRSRMFISDEYLKTFEEFDPCSFLFGGEIICIDEIEPQALETNAIVPKPKPTKLLSTIKQKFKNKRFKITNKKDDEYLPRKLKYIHKQRKNTRPLSCKRLMLNYMSGFQTATLLPQPVIKEDICQEPPVVSLVKSTMPIVVVKKQPVLENKIIAKIINYAFVLNKVLEVNEFLYVVEIIKTLNIDEWFHNKLCLNFYSFNVHLRNELYKNAIFVNKLKINARLETTYYFIDVSKLLSIESIKLVNLDITCLSEPTLIKTKTMSLVSCTGILTFKNYFKFLTKLTIKDNLELLDCSIFYGIYKLKLENVNQIDLSGLSFNGISPTKIISVKSKFITNISSLNGIDTVKLSLEKLVDITPLKNTKTIILNKCFSINNIDYLEKLETLVLRKCPQIKNVSDLLKVPNLTLEKCDGIYDISALWNIKNLKIVNCQNIRDLSPLLSGNRLWIENCQNINYVGGLYNIKNITIVNCKNIKNIEALKLINPNGIINIY